ncbi:hypothetical protein HDF23_000424 [Mucilaginibacter lappiensis]|uniref:inorganic diphosphatase n=1 Tax=Mucilaginibacter lappiensis TaxID=354630 RepID=A0ABR6PD82_9SPHI|nr:hypothetical protein [Mucilaginibacter lappiensis]
MIPGTKGEDGDPLDIIVVSESGTFPGCRIDCRIIVWPPENYWKNMLQNCKTNAQLSIANNGLASSEARFK